MLLIISDLIHLGRAPHPGPIYRNKNPHGTKRFHRRWFGSGKFHHGKIFESGKFHHGKFLSGRRWNFHGNFAACRLEIISSLFFLRFGSWCNKPIRWAFFFQYKIVNGYLDVILIIVQALIADPEYIPSKTSIQVISHDHSAFMLSSDSRHRIWWKITRLPKTPFLL